MRVQRAVLTALGIAATLLVAVAPTSSAENPHHKPVKSPVRAAVGKAGAVTPMVTNGSSFLEVNSANQLVYWTRSGTTFVRQVRGTGWHTARLITSMSINRFLEIKTDGRLAQWNWINGGYQQTIVGSGWQGSRTITGLDNNRFLEIKPNYDLALWQWVNGGYQQTIVGTGWQTARLITGMSSELFFEVKTDGRLAQWYWDNGLLQQYVEETFDFNGVRLMVGLDMDHLVVVDHNGALREYVWEGPDAGYVPYVRGSGWQPARLLG